MDEGELLTAILETIGHNALKCAAEIRVLRAQAERRRATREDESTQDGAPSDLDG